ncbi:RHS repeat-associated core domain-containing protein [Pseudomonas sp. 3A(2025)]
MSLPKPEPLCRYRYDPLDRLASCLPLGQAETRGLYRLNRLTTEIQGQIGTSWLQAQDQLLAQWQQDAGKHDRVLIATDAPGSVIHALGADQSRAFGYMPYGTRTPKQAPLHLPGFNGERPDPVTGHYLLGNGYRAFNPVLMRFNSPDSLSPFGEGGLNAYAYCVGDPVNRVDPSGHTPLPIKSFLRRLGLMKKARNVTPQVSMPTSAQPTNATTLGTNVSLYDLKKNGQLTMVIAAHGNHPSALGHPSLAMGNGTITPELLNYKISKAGANTDNYAGIDLRVCYSANGGDNSLAARLAEETGLPVKGYMDSIIVKPGPEYIFDQINQKTHHVRQLPNGKFDLLFQPIVYKKNIFKAGRGLSKNFSYTPVWHSKL